MYKILTIRDKIKVPPSKFSLGLKGAVIASLESQWEGLIDRDLGVILAIVDVTDIGEGKIIPGNGSIYFPVEFKILVYAPQVHELVKGSVIDVTEFGAFIRFGPLDGMIHVSQIMDDFVSYDGKNSTFIGRDTRRVLKENDTVKARIVSISMGKEYKIGLTTRQPGLGVPTWQERKLPEKPKERPKGKHRR